MDDSINTVIVYLIKLKNSYKQKWLRGDTQNEKQ